MNSNNLNYRFYVEYFENLPLLMPAGEKWSDEEKKIMKEPVQKANDRIMNHAFSDQTVSPVSAWSEIPGFRSFRLKTAYPGLLIGTGNAHDLKLENAIKCGFTFDFVTGLPYIPGSSLKGALRAYFPGDKKPEAESQEYDEYIQCILKKLSVKSSPKKNKKKDAESACNTPAPDFNVGQLRDNIFENGDVFLGAFPVLDEEESRSPMTMEYITPHNKGKFKNPIPVSLVKVKPGVTFEFCFLLKDYGLAGADAVTAEMKEELFRQIILDMGVGAKTNVGFGLFLEKRESTRSKDSRSDNEAPQCSNENCANRVEWDEKTGIWNEFCSKCMENPEILMAVKLKKWKEQSDANSTSKKRRR